LPLSYNYLFIFAIPPKAGIAEKYLALSANEVIEVIEGENID
jgi:hypothetical protein